MPECTEEGLPAGLDFRRGALHKLVQAADDLVLGQHRWATDSFTAIKPYFIDNSPVLNCSKLISNLITIFLCYLLCTVLLNMIHILENTSAVLLGYNGAYLSFST
jgi:hypothetical protein